MDDEPDWRRKKTLVDRAGSGRGGGRGDFPPTAIGVHNPGGGGPLGNTLGTRIAICHSDPAFVFALKILLEPFVQQNLVEFVPGNYFELKSGAVGYNKILVDVVVSEIVEGVNLKDSELEDAVASKTYPANNRVRSVVYTSTDIASKYFCRLFSADVKVCCWQFGLASLVRVVTAGISEGAQFCSSDTNFFKQPLLLPHFDRFLLPRHRLLSQRLLFNEEVVCAELQLTPDSVRETKSDLHQTLGTKCDEELVAKLALMDIIQLPADPDPEEFRTYEVENLSAISTWLTNQLSVSVS